MTPAERVELTQAKLKELLDYDSGTGIFTWRARSSRCIHVGDIAGHTHKKTGYVYISICNVSYSAHRLAWFYMTNEWPKFEIDHEDGISSNNRWKNLRDVTHAVNLQNQRKAQKGNSTGFLGVSPNGKGFQARIGFNKRTFSLGTYPTPELAYEVRLKAKAKRELHPEANCIWADNITQNTNRATSRFITYNGVTKTISGWARKLGANRQTLHERFKKGWSEEMIINTPIRPKKNVAHKKR